MPPSKHGTCYSTNHHTHPSPIHGHYQVITCTNHLYTSLTLIHLECLNSWYTSLVLILKNKQVIGIHRHENHHPCMHINARFYKEIHCTPLSSEIICLKAKSLRYIRSLSKYYISKIQILKKV